MHYYTHATRKYSTKKVQSNGGGVLLSLFFCKSYGGAPVKATVARTKRRGVFVEVSEMTCRGDCISEVASHNDSTNKVFAL